jgi:TPR repeat protein
MLSGTQSGGAAQSSEQKQPETVEVVPSATINTVIPAEEVARTQEEALQGSPDAAFRLAAHFGSLENESQQIHWLQIAVENGNLPARFFLAETLSRQDDALNRIRARFWYKKIIADGPSDQSAKAMEELAAWEKYEKRFPLRSTRH